MDHMMFQTIPIFGRRPVGEVRLIRDIRTRPMCDVVYVNKVPTEIGELPADGFLVVNGEPAALPLTVTDGDLLMWVPGTEC